MNGPYQQLAVTNSSISLTIPFQFQNRNRTVSTPTPNIGSLDLPHLGFLGLCSTDSGTQQTNGLDYKTMAPLV